MVETIGRVDRPAHRHPRAPHRRRERGDRPTSPSGPPSRRWSAPRSRRRRSTSSWWAPPRGDMIFPTTANIVQHRLGCRNAGSVDVYAACSGSIYSLSIGAQYIQTGKYQHRAVHRRRVPLAHHRLHRSRHVHPARRRRGRGGARPSDDERGHHRHRSLLGRPLLGPAIQPGRRLAASGHPRDGRQADALRQDEGQRGLQGGGADVRGLRRAHPRRATASPPTTSTSSSRTRRTSASSRRRSSGSSCRWTRVIVNVDRYGNTGAASVYVALEEAMAAGRLKRRRSRAAGRLRRRLHLGRGALRW